MTTEQLAWLAEEFCGAEVLEYADGTPYIWLLNGRELCKVDEFNPDTDPAHGDVVLRALEAKYYHVEVQCFANQHWSVRGYATSHDCDKEVTSAEAFLVTDGRWPAVCLAALATKGDGG